MSSHSLTRRDFHKRVAGATLGMLGLKTLLEGRAEAQSGTSSFSKLVKDPKGIFDLPKGFEYRIISKTGETMNDGLLVPGYPDGMAAFQGSRGETVLIRNHELKGYPGDLCAFGKENELVAKVDKTKLYDRAGGHYLARGGTTTLIYDTKKKVLKRQFLSLAGTVANCAGGPTPWGSWISCEETNLRGGKRYEEDHGYNFEVSSKAKGLSEAVPLKAMGRFAHEAIAVHEKSGVVFQTEDRNDSIVTRFLPKKPGQLRHGGILQALVIRDHKWADTRNWQSVDFQVGSNLEVEWMTLSEIDSPKDDLRIRAAAEGAAIFARGEGMWACRDGIYFACTSGGPKKLGQIWRYRPSPWEGKEREKESRGRLSLFVESTNAKTLQNVDNLTFSPWGGLVVAEDGPKNARIHAIDSKGQATMIGRNAANSSELTGVCFSPDGSTLFVNVQKSGWTLAITGPWPKRPRLY